MKITDRMCNVVWTMNANTPHAYRAEGVFKEHSQPTTDSDYSVPGYCTLSISYDDYYRVFPSGYPASLQGDAKNAVGRQLYVYYGDNLYPDVSTDQRYRLFAVRAVTMARNYRTHEIDHVVLTLEEMDASSEWGGGY